MKCCKSMIASAILLALCVSSTVSEAKKPGGGGGGAEYNLVVLAPPDVEINGSYATDLDDFGNVVGRYDDLSNQGHGFYYDLAQDSYLLFGPGVEVHGLNNLGEMVGVDENTGEGLYWRAPSDQNPVTLSPLTGHLISAAFKINDAGIIIGSSREKVVTDPEDPDYPVLPVAVAWKVNQQGGVSAPIVLPFPEGHIRGSAIDLSEPDGDGIAQVAGYSGTLETFPKTALQWEMGLVEGALALISGPTDLGSLNGEPSAAYGVNFDGHIVGKSGNWPFVKPDGETMQTLPSLRKATNGYAGDVNDGGAIVGSQGYLFQGAPVFKAVLWRDAGSVIDLNKKVSLGRSEVLESAFRNNHSGDILGSGFFPGITEMGDVGYLLVPAQ